MSTTRHIVPWSGGMLLLALAITGCGGGGPAKFDVKGKVLYQGKPMIVKEIEGQRVGRLRVWFVQQDVPPPVEPREATVEPDGTFTFQADERPPAGKYRICVTWQDDYPTGPDRLSGKFDESTSPIFRTIPSDTPIEIDVGRPGK